MQDGSLMVELDRGNHYVTSMCTAQVPFFSREAVDRGEKTILRQLSIVEFMW